MPAFEFLVEHRETGKEVLLLLLRIYYGCIMDVSWIYYGYYYGYITDILRILLRLLLRMYKKLVNRWMVLRVRVQICQVGPT